MDVHIITEIRQEQPNDFASVYALTELAFRDMPFADHDEQNLVGRLRNSAAFIPELSLVAILDGEVVGHIMLTRNRIVSGDNVYESLTLGPVSVLPSLQRRGIGGLLIRAVHDKAREMGFTSVLLVGHEHYYPRFGYVPASGFGILSPIEVPDSVFMAVELVEGGLEGVSGTVEYPGEFFI
jgi:predicted N-acetyltransferase YhbS